MTYSTDILFALNRLRWPWRIPVKWLILGFTVLGVCFPNPVILYRHLDHWRDPNALIEPNAPGVRAMADELRPTIADDTPPHEVLHAVQDLVYRSVPYEWDWNTWGSADYLPTVGEVFEQGREDCDGRAVVAASVLKQLGYEATLVTDFAHVWVRTEVGETMSPGETPAIVVGEKGIEIQSHAFAEMLRASTLGIRVFPLFRELIVIAVAWWLLWSPGAPRWYALTALASLVGGLLCVRAYGPLSIVWLHGAGLVMMLVGVVLPLWAARGLRGRARETV